MAQRVKIILEDDLTGGPADETVRFGLDSNTYEIDLSSANAEKFREALAEYVAVARRSSAPAKAARRAGGPAKNQETAQIRRWAAETGHKVSSRGRIQAEIVEAYRKAHS